MIRHANSSLFKKLTVVQCVRAHSTRSNPTRTIKNSQRLSKKVAQTNIDITNDNKPRRSNRQREKSTVELNTFSRDLGKDIKKMSPKHLSTELKMNPAFLTGPPNSGEFARLRAVPPEERIKTANVISKIDTFEALKINNEVRESILNNVLGHLEYKKPSAIQTLGIRAIQAKRRHPDEFRSFLLAAETGSGKTLAYLAPLLSKLKDQEDAMRKIHAQVNDDKPSDTARTSKTMPWDYFSNLPVVRSLILVPTLELVSQVTATVKKISYSAKVSSFAITNDISLKAVKENLESRRIDVLITTPDKFLHSFKNEASLKGHLKFCQTVVVDEADTLMDKSFLESTQHVLSLTQHSELRDLVFCSATIPRNFDKTMRKFYPDIERIVTPSLHKIPRHIDFRVIEVFNPPYLNSKTLALQQALYAIHNDNTEQGIKKRVVVFLNHKKDIKPLADLLNSKGYDARYVSGDMDSNERKALVQEFVGPAEKLPTEGEEASKQPNKVQVLLTSDLLARGIDMDNVRNVILYDLPYSSVDLLHRSGRTGRMGKRGRVFLFVEKKESRGWVKGLEKVVKRGMSLA